MKTHIDFFNFHFMQLYFPPSEYDDHENDPHRKMIPILKSENDHHINFGNIFKENDPQTENGK